MTIRLQNLLIIPPIFLILGLAVGVLADRAAREEILWGLREESSAVAVTVAEMTGGDALDALSAGDTAAVRRVSQDLADAARYGQIQSLVLYSQIKDGPVLAWHADSTAVTLEAELWRRSVKGLRSQQVLDEEPGPWGPYPESMVAAAPIFSPAGGTEPRGAVAVVINASRLGTITKQLHRNFLLLGLVVTLIGVVAALFLSMRIGRQVRELGRLGTAVASGDYRTQVRVAGVKEVQDLSNTLGTMASILSDVLTRGRRALLVGDPFQLAQAVPWAYREARLRDASPPSGLSVAVSFIGAHVPGCFHGWTGTGRHRVVWVGEIDQAASIEVAIAAATANAAIARALELDEPEAVAKAAIELFELSALQMAWVAAEGTDPPEMRSFAGSGEPLEVGGHHVIHSFRADQMATLSGSLSLFKDLSPEDAARELPLAFPQGFSGTVVLIRPSGRHSEEAST